jgi:PAS domain S-box-containing protein
VTPRPPSADPQRENEILRRENEALRRGLAEAEQVNEALTKGKIDAVVDAAHQVPLLLRQAQGALQASEEKYRTIVTAAEEGIWTVDANMVATFANERMASMLGYTVPELIGRTVVDFVDVSARDEALQGFVRRRQDVRERRDLPLRRKDGRVLWASVTLSPLVDPDGRFAGSVGMVTDVTERKRAEEALRESEAEMKEAQRVAHVGSWSWVIETDTVTWSEELFHITGRDPAGTPPSYFEGHATVYIPESLARLQSLVERATRTGEPYEADLELIRPDGTARWVVATGEARRDAKGQIVGLRGTVEDITERRRATERLRESEERYRSLFDGSPLPMWLFDQETLAIAAVNEAAVQHYGYSREEFLSKTLREIWHPDEVAVAIARLARFAASPGESGSAVRRHVKKGGASITVEVFCHAVQLAGRHYRLSAIRDITDQRELEERLRQSQKMEAVGRLAGGVAHDFNNLLTVIFGYCDVLLHGLELGPLHEAAQEVRRAGERAAALTRQLLAFSRKQNLVPEVLDMGDVVSGLSTMVERLIGEEVKVSVVVSPNLGRVKADRGQLEQVVMNLAVNARDAMPKGGSLIFELQNVELDDSYTATHAEVTPGPYVLLAISDTGTGMDAETQKHVFEPFFTTKEAGKGTGLGLSTVHGIVLQSGGSISVYSEPGRGTTFKVYLPRFAGDAAVPRSLSGIHPALPAGSGSETVLVVEDEAAIRQLTKLILQKAGYTVLLAESPVAAERIAGSHPGPIHLLLTDVVMPGMRGPELAERLLRLRPDLRVLFMSGYTDEAIAHHGMLDAGTEFLQKPFTPNVLLRKVREVLT